MEWSGVRVEESSRVSGVESNERVDWTSSGVDVGCDDASGVEWSGVDGVEWSGVEWSGASRVESSSGVE